MTAFDTNRPVSADAGLRALFNRAARAVSIWNERRATRIALSRLSDRELDDIGLSRGDIDTIAREI